MLAHVRKTESTCNPEMKEQDMPSVQSARILIVEDEIIPAKSIAYSLTSFGHEVVGIAASGAEALELVIAEKPDLILMDINLKGPMDGIGLTQRIQAVARTPVVYLTAYSDTETLKRVLHTRPYGYLTKPFDEEELRVAVQKALERTSGQL